MEEGASNPSPVDAGDHAEINQSQASTFSCYDTPDEEQYNSDASSSISAIDDLDDFFAAPTVGDTAPCKALKDDVAAANRRYRAVEEEIGVLAVQMDSTKMTGNNRTQTTIQMALSLSAVPPSLLSMWDLHESPFISVFFDAVSKELFRKGSFPVVRVEKGCTENPDEEFAVGRQLYNLAKSLLASHWAEVTDVEEAGPSDTAEADAMDIGPSIFSHIYTRLAERITNLTEHCMVCDSRLAAPGVLPSVCDEPLCTYQFTELRLFNGVSAPRVAPEVLNLLLYAFDQANSSPRRNLIFEPKPNIRSPEKLNMEVHRHKLARQEEEHVILQQLCTVMLCPKKVLESATAYRQWAEANPRSAEVIEWLVISNRSYIEKMPRPVAVEVLGTAEQFLFVSDTPAKQRDFDAIVEAYGGRTRFFFHGSPSCNWHSIIRTGLRNMSGTKYQMVGAVHGPGIYLSPRIQVSLGYTQGKLSATRREDCQYKGCCLNKGFQIVALVEVVDSDVAYRKATSDIYVANDAKYCSLRMLLLCTLSKDELYITRGGDLDSMTDLQRIQISEAIEHFKTADLSARVEHHLGVKRPIPEEEEATVPKAKKTKQEK